MTRLRLFTGSAACCNCSGAACKAEHESASGSKFASAATHQQASSTTRVVGGRQMPQRGGLRAGSSLRLGPDRRAQLLATSTGRNVLSWALVLCSDVGSVTRVTTCRARSWFMWRQ